MRNFSPIVWAVSLLAGAGVVSASQVNVAFLSALGDANHSYEADIIGKIEADAPFLNITPIYVDTTTPALSTLETTYQTLIVAGNNPFADSNTLGNELKQYIDDGFGLVMMANANQAPFQNSCNTGAGTLCGAFDTNNYWAIGTGPTVSGTHQTLGTVFVSNSPILTGVPSGSAGFDGGSSSFRVNGLLNGSATEVAAWNDAANTPFIATRTFVNGSKVANEVALNFFPVPGDATPNFGFWLTSSAGAQIMANAIVYAGNIQTTTTDPIPEAGGLLTAGVGLVGLSLVIRSRRR